MIVVWQQPGPPGSVFKPDMSFAKGAAGAKPLTRHDALPDPVVFMESKEEGFA
jgi:hypothetical protein